METKNPPPFDPGIRLILGEIRDIKGEIRDLRTEAATDRKRFAEEAAADRKRFTEEAAADRRQIAGILRNMTVILAHQEDLLTENRDVLKAILRTLKIQGNGRSGGNGASRR